LRTALVTGAGRGIGRAIALALASDDVRVIVHYGQNRAGADEVVAQIRAAGGQADAVAAELSIENGPHDLAKEVARRVGDRLDILVANAGIATSRTLASTTVADFNRLFAINVRAPFFLVQQLLPVLGEGSSVVFLSSMVAQSAGNALSAYGASKGAIDSLVKQFAHELGPRGIRVNAVAPGVVDTDMSKFVRSEMGRKGTLSMQALKRIAEPRDIADAVAFLTSDKARWITGDVIRVDGGSKL
jgi:3-oxoacyl-[acyl-carrier protein] reductase